MKEFNEMQSYALEQMEQLLILKNTQNYCDWISPKYILLDSDKIYSAHSLDNSTRNDILRRFERIESVIRQKYMEIRTFCRKQLCNYCEMRASYQTYWPKTKNPIEMCYSCHQCMVQTLFNGVVPSVEGRAWINHTEALVRFKPKSISMKKYIIENNIRCYNDAFPYDSMKKKYYFLQDLLDVGKVSK